MIKNHRLFVLLIILTIVLVVFLVLDYQIRKSRESLRNNREQIEVGQVDLCLYGPKSMRLTHCSRLIREGKRILREINTMCANNTYTTDVKYFTGVPYKCADTQKLTENINKFVLALRK